MFAGFLRHLYCIYYMFAVIYSTLNGFTLCLLLFTTLLHILHMFTLFYYMFRKPALGKTNIPKTCFVNFAIKKYPALFSQFRAHFSEIVKKTTKMSYNIGFIFIIYFSVINLKKHVKQSETYH